MSLEAHLMKFKYKYSLLMSQVAHQARDYL